MTYLEGIGDEVLITVAVVVVIVASLLLWGLTETNTTSLPSSSSQHISTQRPVTEERRFSRGGPDPSTSTPERPTEGSETETQNHTDQLAEETRAHIENYTVHDQSQSQDFEPDCDDNENVDIRQRRLDFFKNNSMERLCTTETVVNSPVLNGVSDPQPQELEGTPAADPESVHIRLKYLDDTERLVQTQLSQNIQQFKRIHFADELANNRLVRLISTGYVLEDSRTLQSYGLMDNSVIHVQIQTNQVNSRRVSHEAESELDIGQFLSPILGVTLLCVWIMHFQYKEYFSTTSTVALLVLSVLFLTVVWGQHGGSRTVNTPVQ